MTKNPKEASRSVKKVESDRKWGTGCRKGLLGLACLPPQVAQKVLQTLATTVLKFSVAGGSSWPEGGAKGRAFTLKLKARSPKLVKLS